MIKFLGLMAVILCTSMAYARPGVNFQYGLNGQGNPQLKIVGQDLCDSNTFRIRITNELNGDKGWYESESHNTEWNISKNQRTGACTLNMFLAKKYLVPGYTLEVRTYADKKTGNGRKLHTFAVTIPCQEAIWSQVFVDSNEIYETDIARSIVCSGNPADPSQISQPVVVQPVPQTPNSITCNSNIIANGSSAKVSVNCSEPLGADVAVYSKSNGNRLCEDPNFYARTSDFVACTFERDRAHHLDYEVKINSLKDGTLISRVEGSINKDATYNYPPQGTLVSNRYIQPEAQNKLGWSGQYWDAFIKAQVIDNDVDSSEGLSLIKVDLIKMINGGEQIVKSTTSNSGETVEFKVEHQYVKPWVGKPHEDSSGYLDRGTNVFKVRVHDAYNGGATVDLPETTVVVPN